MELKIENKVMEQLIFKLEAQVALTQEELTAERSAQVIVKQFGRPEHRSAIELDGLPKLDGPLSVIRAMHDGSPPTHDEDRECRGHPRCCPSSTSRKLRCTAT